MTPQELGSKAVSSWNSGVEILQLVLPPKKSDNKYRYMAGKNSPKGEIVGTMKTGTVVNFKTLDVLAWCMAHDIVYDAITTRAKLEEDANV